MLLDDVEVQEECVSLSLLKYLFKTLTMEVSFDNMEYYLKIPKLNLACKFTTIFHKIYQKFAGNFLPLCNPSGDKCTKHCKEALPTYHNTANRFRHKKTFRLKHRQATNNYNCTHFKVTKLILLISR